MHIRAFWPMIGPNGVETLRKAPWVLTREEQTRVKSTIADFQTPTGHMHCLKGAFTSDNKLTGLRTHD